MWVIVMVMVSAMGGSRMQVIRYAAYASEESCQHALAAYAPARLDMAGKSEYVDGFRRFVCVRLNDMDIVNNPK